MVDRSDLQLAKLINFRALLLREVSLLIYSSMHTRLLNLWCFSPSTVYSVWGCPDNRICRSLIYLCFWIQCACFSTAERSYCCLILGLTFLFSKDLSNRIMFPSCRSTSWVLGSFSISSAFGLMAPLLNVLSRLPRVRARFYRSIIFYQQSEARAGCSDRWPRCRTFYVG